MIKSRHDDRKSLRRPTRRAATVSLGAEKPSVPCVIWDISEGGARLAVAPVHRHPGAERRDSFREFAAGLGA